MKADVKSADKREEEALAWAINFFHNCAAEMREKNERRSEEIVLSLLISGYDSSAQKQPDQLDEMLAKFVDAFRTTGRSVRTVLQFAAFLIERGDRLPAPLATFVVEFLREPDKLRSRRGPKRLLARDLNIGGAVAYVVGRWKFSATRNREQKTKGPCGASIVREALAKGVGMNLGEEDIAKIWRKFMRGFRAGGRMAFTVGKGQLLAINFDDPPSEKLQAN
jgi:hypothetical protein